MALSPDPSDVSQGALALSPDPLPLLADPPEYLSTLIGEGLPEPGETDTWPRLMSGRHPEAVGSYGAEACQWIDERSGVPLRWWQRLTVHRALEHREDGSLCWETVLLSTTRQVGKSYLLREVLLWRMEHGERFGNVEPDALLFTANHLDVSREVWRPAMLWAQDLPGWVVRMANGEQRIEHPNGARWLVRAVTGAGYGFTLAMAVVDEAWDIPPDVVDDRLAPTMISRESPQLWLVSTAHAQATTLIPNLRRAALAVLAEPEHVLLLEWSADPSRAADDQTGWREASPFWDDRRRRFMARQWQTSAEDSFRAQWLNSWPSASSQALCDEETWAGLAVEGLEVPTDSRPLWLALDSISGGGATLVTGWTDEQGHVCLKAEHRLPLVRALTRAHDLAGAHPGSTLLLGASLDAMVDRLKFPGEVALAGIRETRQSTHLFQGMTVEGRVHHDGDPALASQVTGAAVIVTDAGPVMSGTRSPGPVDAARGSLWVTWAAQTQGATTPAIF